jgi:hypothetical protein
MSDILDTPMVDNDADAETLGEFLGLILMRVWQQQDGFSGKRPFGNSGWTWYVYESLAAAGEINAVERIEFEGTEDEFVDYDIDFDERRRADQMILTAIAKRMWKNG